MRERDPAARGLVAAVAAVLAGVLSAAHDAGLIEVELDGHDADRRTPLLAVSPDIPG